MSFGSVAQFNTLIDRIIDKRIKKLKLPRTKPAVINLINNNGTVDITIPPSTEVVHGIQNKSGETLSIGDSVFLMLIDGSMSNAVIWIKRKG